MSSAVEGRYGSRQFPSTPQEAAHSVAKNVPPNAFKRFILKHLGPLVAQEALVDCPWLIAVAPAKAAETPKPPLVSYAEYLEKIPDNFADCNTDLQRRRFVELRVKDLPHTPSLFQAISLLTQRMMAGHATDTERLHAYVKTYVELRERQKNMAIQQ